MLSVIGVCHIPAAALVGIYLKNIDILNLIRTIYIVASDLLISSGVCYSGLQIVGITALRLIQLSYDLICHRTVMDILIQLKGQGIILLKLKLELTP